MSKWPMRLPIWAAMACTGLGSPTAGAQTAGGCGTVRVGLNTVAADTWFVGDRNSPEGPLADLARAALASQGCGVVLQRLPLARLILDAEQGLVDIALPVTVTPERRKVLRFPETASGDVDNGWALGRSRVSLFALASRASHLNARRLDTQLPAATLAVVVQRASVGEALASQAGWSLLYAPDAERAVSMLRLHRGDMMIAPDWSLGRATLNEATAVVALQQPLASPAYFAPVSQAFWQRDPQRAQAIWRALCQHAALLGGAEEACTGLRRPAAAPTPPPAR